MRRPASTRACATCATSVIGVSIVGGASSPVLSRSATVVSATMLRRMRRATASAISIPSARNDMPSVTMFDIECRCAAYSTWCGTPTATDQPDRGARSKTVRTGVPSRLTSSMTPDFCSALCCASLGVTGVPMSVSALTVRKTIFPRTVVEHGNAVLDVLLTPQCAGHRSSGERGAENVSDRSVPNDRDTDGEGRMVAHSAEKEVGDHGLCGGRGLLDAGGV